MGNEVYINGKFVADPNNYLNVFKHENGHSIGLPHASTWTNGANNEYGDGSSPMGYCQRCAYVAPTMLQLGWSSTVASIRGSDLNPGGTLRYMLPALTGTPKSVVQIFVDWTRPNGGANGSRPVGDTPSIFLSYRVAKGQDIGLPAAFDRAVSVHSVATGGGNTYLEAALMGGNAWHDDNFNLVVAAEVTPSIPSATATGPVDGVHVRVCRYVTSVLECGSSFFN